MQTRVAALQRRKVYARAQRARNACACAMFAARVRRACARVNGLASKSTSQVAQRYVHMRVAAFQRCAFRARVHHARPILAANAWRARARARDLRSVEAWRRAFEYVLCSSQLKLRSGMFKRGLRRCIVAQFTRARPPRARREVGVRLVHAGVRVRSAAVAC
eukprot:5302401-Lingulodinium_polyedra.AAC.1